MVSNHVISVRKNLDSIHQIGTTMTDSLSWIACPQIAQSVCYA
jgi:hypothetical protein